MLFRWLLPQVAAVPVKDTLPHLADDGNAGERGSTPAQGTLAAQQQRQQAARGGVSPAVGPAVASQASDGSGATYSGQRLVENNTALAGDITLQVHTGSHLLLNACRGWGLSTVSRVVEVRLCWPSAAR